MYQFEDIAKALHKRRSKYRASAIRQSDGASMVAAGHLPPSYSAGAAFLVPLICLAAAWWAFAPDRKRQ